MSLLIYLEKLKSKMGFDSNFENLVTFTRATTTSIHSDFQPGAAIAAALVPFYYIVHLTVLPDKFIV